LQGQSFTLAELAELTGSELSGDGNLVIDSVAPLETAESGSISFLANPRYRRAVATTRASAVILPMDMRASAPAVPAVFSNNPYLAFARVARALNPQPPAQPGVDSSAWVAPGAYVDPAAEVAPHAVVHDESRIGAGSVVCSGAVIGVGAVLGADCVIGPNVTIAEGCQLGDRVQVSAGAVIGADGFGFAQDGERWEAVPQLGTVQIEDDVSIGANTTVDRGSQGDTRIRQGCKIDNLVQIAHNVEVGEHTVIAACTGISGSTRIGRCCIIAGSVGIAGHLNIADGTTFTGMAMVTGNVREAGVYSSGIPAMPAQDWRRSVVRFRQLDAMARRIDALEKALERMNDDNNEHTGP